MSRHSKIARLPRAVRDELNLRLMNGESGAQLVTWLNTRPDVRESLATHFSSRAITEQNLSDWRQGGYEDWLAYQDARDWIRDTAEKCADLQNDSGLLSVTDWLSTPLAIALGRCIHRLMDGAPHSVEERKDLIVLSREVSNLRRGDHQQQSLRFQRERWEAQNPPKS